MKAAITAGTDERQASPADAPAAPEPTGLRARSWLVNADLIALVGIASALWAFSVHAVDVRELTDLGLGSVLPLLGFGALLVLTLSFVLCLRDPRSPLVFLLHLSALVVMLYGIAPLVEDGPRFGSTWAHMGVADQIAAAGNVDPRIDPNFNWPGFFAFSAFVTEVAGLPDAVELAAWAPVLLNLLYLGPLVLIVRAVTDDERLVWLSAWLFCVANWVGQDFFAPQGLSYFLYLVILAILLRWFTVAPAGSAAGAGWANAQLASGTWPPWTTEPDPELPPAKRGALLAIAIVCFGALVSMHQLTAVAVLACVTALVALRRSRARWLPVLMAGVIGAWITFPAATYSVGLPGELIGLTDSIAGSVEQSIGGAAEGSDDHRAIVQLRLVLTLGLGALAALGAVRAFRGGRRDLTVGVLAVAPLPFLLLQPEGGELVLRLYVFSLPFVAFFAASAFYPGRAVVFTKRDLVRSWRTTRVLLLASVAFAVGFFFVRYGNERADSFTADEVRAVEALYAAAPPGSVLVAANGNLPWRFEHLAEYDYKQVVRAAAWTSLASSRSSMRAVVAEVVRLMRREGHGRAYLIITRSQKAAADLLGSGPKGSLSRFETAVAGSSAFSLVYENRDAAIYVLGGGGRGPAT